MSLILQNDDIIKILSKKKNESNIDNLITKIINTFTLTKNLLSPLSNGKLKGYEKSTYGKINPLLWEFGHVINFWIENTIKLIKYDSLKLKNEYLFDSHKVDKETRFEVTKSNKIEPIERMLVIYDSALTSIVDNLLLVRVNNLKLDNVTSYLINLSLLHNEMHNESFCFSLQSLEFCKPKFYNINYTLFDEARNLMNKNIENRFIKIKGGSFNQGWNDTEDNFTFDNERPEFKVSVKDFEVSKYCISQGEFMKFVNVGGYKNKNYWCYQGWRWVQKNNITMPLYWKYVSTLGSVLKLDWGLLKSIDPNKPIVNISWYEANAYCRWANYRLPTESEWEYLATNGGTTTYPWGDENVNDNVANLNYKFDGVVDVDLYKEGNNKDGVQQLFGNCWEWCQEPIYPYNGFEIDPVYREMSYPFFGFKKICRGGAWCVPDFLINSKYRNAQMPDCRIQYIGFRVVKNISF
jgi:iron(II)-dependent oxidoreductase